MVVLLDKVLTVGDGTTGAPYWQLTRVDDAGRTRTEVLGKVLAAAQPTKRRSSSESRSWKRPATSTWGAAPSWRK